MSCKRVPASRGMLELAMDSDTTKLALELCHIIRSDVAEVREDMREINRRLTTLETAVNMLARATWADRTQPT